MKRREFLKAAGAIAFGAFYARSVTAGNAGDPLGKVGDGRIKVRFTGTGGADWSGKTKDGGETRANAGVFLQDRVLVDLTVSNAKNLPERAEPEAIFYTHSHPDHYQPQVLSKFRSIKRVYVHEGWLAKAEKDVRRACRSSPPEVIGVRVGETYVESEMAFTPLKADHFTGLEGEQCLVYCVRTRISHLLYATDTSGLMAESVSCIKTPLTGLIMNAMIGVGRAGRGRLFAHSSPELVSQTAKALKAIGKYRAKAGQPVWTTHLSYTMNGCHAEVEKEYPQGVVPAYDGLEVSV